MSVKRVFIVRHGETDFNVSQRWQGHLDVPLNANGYHQAQLLAQYLMTANIEIDAIYASDLSRAFETAVVIGQAQGIKVISDPRLREVNVGIFQGMTLEEMSLIAPDVLEKWKSDDSYVISNGESRLMLQDRAYAAWVEITARRDVDSVMLVAHGGTIRMLLYRLLPSELVSDKRFANTSLTILDRVPGGKIRPKYLGITPHLSDL